MRRRPSRRPATDPVTPGGTHTLAFVESPVQLLNVLEWLHTHPAGPGPSGPAGAEVPAGGVAAPGTPGPRATALPGATGAPGPPGVSATRGTEPRATTAGDATGERRTPGAGRDGICVVVLSNNDPMTRGQLRRMAELAREEGIGVRWEDARGGPTAPLRTVGSLARALRRARRVVIGDPFSRYVQLLLGLTSAREIVVVDDGTATMEFVAQLARGERLVRWHRNGAGGLAGVRDAVYAPVAGAARRRFAPRAGRTVEVFSSMPVEAPDGITVTVNDFAWTRARFGPPHLTKGADLVGTNLAETGVVGVEPYLRAVAALAREHGATRYFAHRRESTGKLHRLAEVTGLEIVRPELPLELIARRGPIGRTVVSFPSTVLHTLPLALAGTEVRVAACDIDPAWLTEHASPRAEGFLAVVSGTARDVHHLRSAPSPGG
ncbi:collagen-like triple helix repeat-containing protein [Streptomyces zingiberis]|uniref:Uncharacterized protein n=1 Tax=Streptomyces zingiberis TaxID=2053010 RepID=A0ABX1C159_9ACTN|nr:collagen-like protein [Streptomyces zingiberis]NJQ00634.1 hypothetical protein [Streptomyces zingiberis]